MASRNELLGQMRRPPTPEEMLRELEILRKGGLTLSTKQKIRLDELEKWHVQYLREREEFRHWVFHPSKGEKVAESRDEFERALKDGWYATRDELKAAMLNPPKEPEVKEEPPKESEREKQLVFLKRSIVRDSGAKMLYAYSSKELIKVYEKLGLEYDKDVLSRGAKGRIELYKKLKDYIELNA